MADETKTTKGAASTKADDKAPATVTVKALRNICEGGEHYAKDETFEVEPARAKALGSKVEIV